MLKKLRKIKSKGRRFNSTAQDAALLTAAATITAGALAGQAALGRFGKKRSLMDGDNAQ